MFTRSIVVDGERWRYRVGYAFVRFIPPKGKAFVASIADVTGRDWQVIERGRWKRTADASVFPRDIVRFIRWHRSLLERALAALAGT